MKNKIVWIVVLVIIVVGGIWIFNYNKGIQNDNGKPVVKIVLPLPLTGDVAFLGQSARNIVDLLQSSIPKDAKYNYEFLYEDNKFLPTETVSIVRETLGRGVNNFIIIDASQSLAVLPILNQENAFSIHIGSDPSVANGKNNFWTYTPTSELVNKFVQELQKRNVKKVAIVSANITPAYITVGEIKKQFAKNNIEIVFDETVNSGETDFRVLISKLGKVDFDVLLNELYYEPSVSVFQKQLLESDLTDFSVFSAESIDGSSDLALFNDSWFVATTQPSKSFLNMYKINFDQQTPQWGSIQVYESASLLVNTIEKIGDGKTIPTTEQISQAFHDLKKFNGTVFDGEISISESGIIALPPALVEIKNGEMLVIE